MTERAYDNFRTGVVTAFEPLVGLGVVVDDEGTEYAFHCIEIADGSRDIAVGTEVGFDVMPKFGRWEAARVRS